MDASADTVEQDMESTADFLHKCSFSPSQIHNASSESYLRWTKGETFYSPSVLSD